MIARQLIESLKEGVPVIGLHSDNETELYDIEAADETMFEAAAALEELQAEASRYRWLRDKSCPPHNFYVSVPDEFKGVQYSALEVDAYIDAAIAKMENLR